MNPTNRQLEILEFCEEPKLAKEIAMHLDLQVASIYKYMTSLIKSGYLKTKSANGKPSGTQLFFTDQDFINSGNFKAADPEISSFNMDFIRAAHNPFNLVANHG